MIYTTYNNSGEIIGTYSISNNDVIIEDNYIIGNYNSLEYYIDNNQPVKKPEQPSKYHEFNYNTKQYELNVEYLKIMIRTQRTDLLSEIDKMNPIWYDTLSEEQKEELKQYRQALLDVPQQSSFPEDVIWPVKPEWFL